MKRGFLWIVGLGALGFAAFLVLVVVLAPKPKTLDELPMPRPTPPREQLGGDPLLTALAYDLSRFNLWTSREEVRSLYSRACQGPGALACAAEKVQEGPRRRRELYTLFDSACDDDTLLPCIGAAYVLTSTPTLVPATPRRFLEHLVHHCEAGEMSACAEIAGPANPAPDYEAGRRACAAGEALACVYLTSAPDTTVEQADAWLALACKSGVLAACTSLEEARTLDDPSRSLEALEGYCARGDHLACDLVGHLLEKVEGVPRDPDRALEAYRVACRGGVPSGCYGVGRALLGLVGAEVEKDYERASTLLRSACDGGVLDACYEFADALALATWYGGKSSDPKTAVELLDRLCQQKHEMSCAGYAWMLGEGIGVTRDIERARALILPLYESEDPDVLMNLAVRFHEGSGGVDRDLDKARALYDKSCRRRHADACAALVKLR